MKLSTVLFAAGSATAAARTAGEIESMFEQWRIDFSKEFETVEEYLSRLSIFASNLKMIETHNAQNSTWTMAMNEFGHLTGDEFKAIYSSEIPEHDPTVPREVFTAPGLRISDSKDWRTEGAVTDVKNQGQCGSCWAFSTTGAVEGAYFLKNKELVSFSEQNLVDCDKVDAGCNGGLMDNAFAWIKGNGGLCKEDDYPYTGKKALKCNTACSPVAGSTVQSFTDVSPVPQKTPATDADMMAAIDKQPVSIAIEADQAAFQFYSGGVLTSGCGTQLDHGVLAVGYGTDSGNDYYLVKNSWGSSWGDSGYIKLGRGTKYGSDGQCGMLMAASYPNL